MGQFYVFFFIKREKNSESDGGKKMWLLFRLHSFLHQEFSEVLAGRFYGVYICFTWGRIDYGEAWDKCAGH